LTIPALASRFRVLAPDMVGFGYTERPQGVHYDMDTWVSHVLGFLDALKIDKAHVIGNSFGGALALALAIRAPQRVGRLVLMGSAGLSFPITEGLDRVWGYTPSQQAMREMLDIFAYDRTLVNDELARMRYEASIRPGHQEAYSQMFPAPRQRSVDLLASPESSIRALPQQAFDRPWTRGQGHPVVEFLPVVRVDPEIPATRLWSVRTLDPDRAYRPLQPAGR